MKQKIILTFVTFLISRCSNPSGNNNNLQNLILLGLLTQSSQQQARVTLFSGSSLGQSGNVDGDALDARFNSPQSIVYKKESKLFYLADRRNNVIRKIYENGRVETLAGSGTFGFQDGSGQNAQFKGPSGVALCPDGNLYVTDSSSCSIRRVSEAGLVTTIAGNNTCDYVNGNAATARFYFPEAIVCDKSGNLFIADSANHVIRKMDTMGNVTTFAGALTKNRGYRDGVGNDALFGVPDGLSLNEKTNEIYVFDSDYSRIRKIDSSQIVTTLVTNILGYVNGDISSSRFSSPKNISFMDNGDLIVVDQSNNAIRLISNGQVSTIAGTTIGLSGLVDGYGTAARFNHPRGIVNAGNGVFYITEVRNNVIRKLELF